MKPKFDHHKVILQKTELEFPCLEFEVLLGCLEKEWEEKQVVHIGVRLVFPEPPRAVTSDQISDTICYAEVANKLSAVCEEKPYHLIEHLAWNCFTEVKKIVGLHSGIQIFIEVRKLKPPADHFAGPAIFRVHSSG